jgi:hypothetical protein
MAIGRGFAGKRLLFAVTFGVLLVAAFGVGCKGFFQDATLSSIAIQPPSPQVQVDHSMTLQAWGTDSNNHRSQIKSGVVWTSSDNKIVLIDPSTGQITGKSPGGTATITAAAQGLSATATATAFLGTVSGLTICTGSFNPGGACPAATWSISGQTGGNQNYYAKGDANGTPVDVTTVATWNVTPTATTGGVTCDATNSPAVCTVLPQTTPAAGTIYVITVTYPNITPVTADIQVN